MSSPEETDVGWAWREFKAAPDLIARLFRERRLASHALLDYISKGFRDEERESLRSARRSAIQPILEALRPLPFKWAAAEKKAKAQARRLSQRSTGARGRRVALEIRTVILPLLEAFRDPRSFFAVVAPLICPADFDEKDLFDSDGVTLGLTLQRWGIAAMLNPAVAHAFASPSANIDQILALTKEPPPFLRSGRPRGRGKGKQPKRSSIDWKARWQYFKAAATVLNGDRRMSAAQEKACLRVISKEVMPKLIKMRDSRHLTSRAATGEAYRFTAEHFHTSVTALKKGFERHRNST